MYPPCTEPRPIPPLGESRLNYPVIHLMRSIMHRYARSLGFKKPEMLHPERMIGAWRDFQEGKTRLIVGFRHPYGDDPQLMAYVFHYALPWYARRSGAPLRGLTHAHFVYGVEVPWWSGNFVRWLLPNAGALPVNHVHMDSAGMNRIRRAVSDGAFPLALAPEGHVTYDSESVADLETGTARFGFWCIEDLARQGRTERVVILPISQHYRYPPGAAKPLSRLLARIERECGLSPAPRACTLPEIASRLRASGCALAEHLSAFYSRELNRPVGTSQAELLEASLEAGERAFALERKELEPMARFYRIRAAGWDRIFRDDIAGMTGLRYTLACREAGEAWYAMRHMETSELLFHVDLAAVPDGAGLDRYIEIADNFADYLGRLSGGTLRDRAALCARRAVIVPGEPIVINDYLEEYRKDRKSGLEKATADLSSRFHTCIEEYTNAYR